VLRLSKHHGLGNDFLVIDGDVDAGMARALCDRRTGVGADGLIGHRGRLMTLFNADGSRAEMSGNGIRCLAQAMAAGRDAVLDIETDAGLRRVEVRQVDARTAEVRVGMGAVDAAAVPDVATLGLGAPKDVLGASVGNPHVVALYPDRAALDSAADGFAATDRNIEFVIAGPGPDALTLRVVERGVGETFACGTGACAAAWAARRWGLVGDRVTVHMPGGAATVELGDEVHLVGPAVHVADIEVAWPS
jgi:diaminopimelate epimerase